METNTHVYFGVFGFGDDPSVVTAIMGMAPSKAWVKGEPYASLSPGARRTHSRWALESGRHEVEPVEVHLVALLETLEPKVEEIRRVSQRFDVHIGVAQYFHEVNPQFRIEVDILRRLAALGVPLSFDQYCLGEDEGS